MVAAAGMLFAACSPEEELDNNDPSKKPDNETNGPVLSLAASATVMQNSAVTLELKVEGEADLTEAVTVPVTFAGTAKMNEDYTVSADCFVLGGDGEQLQITVSPLGNFDSAKTITAELGQVEGFTVSNGKCTIEQSPMQRITYSFHSRNAVMSSEVTVQMDLYVNGNSYTVEQDVVIPVEVDTEASTAVEGTHFAFDGAKEVVVKQGKSSGSVTLKLLAEEEGHDVLVLKPTAEFTANPAFVRGDYNTLTITIFGSFFSKIEGTWKMKEVITTAEYLDESWWGMAGTYEGLPEFEAEDTFTFNNDGTLTTSLKSTLKNYFKESSEFSKGDIYVQRVGMAEKYETQVVILHDTNRYFSATEQSEDTESYVGVYFEEGNNDDMYLFLYDHESHSFMPDLLDFGMYNDEKPVAAMTGVFLEYILERVK